MLNGYTLNVSQVENRKLDFHCHDTLEELDEDRP